jgi:hypothetical protein
MWPNTGVVDTIGKFATEVNDATVKLLPTSMKREVLLELGISQNLVNFLKNGTSGIIRGPWENYYEKTWSLNFVTKSLSKYKYSRRTYRWTQMVMRYNLEKEELLLAEKELNKKLRRK